VIISIYIRILLKPKLPPIFLLEALTKQRPRLIEKEVELGFFKKKLGKIKGFMEAWVYSLFQKCCGNVNFVSGLKI
jgi:hypothetical protein